MRRYNILVLGDSISWGQGLGVDERWRALLACQLETTLKRPVHVYAPFIHSGARIGIGDRDEIGYKGMYVPDPALPEEVSYVEGDYGDFGGEIPSGTPTILRQLDRFRDSDFKDPATIVDLVVVSAGINDVSIMRYINPWMNQDVIHHLIEAHCHYHLAALLDRLRTLVIARNDKCRVIALSYFPMLSAQTTSFPPLLALIGALATTPHDVRESHDLKNLERKADAQDKSSARPPLVDDLIAAVTRFYTASERAVQSAVNDANRDLGDGRSFTQHFFHVKPAIDGSHALYTGDPWLWEVALPAPGSVVTSDDARPDRLIACGKIAPPPSALNLNLCHIAAFGHPNVAGASEGYFKAIWETVKTFANDAAP